MSPQIGNLPGMDQYFSPFAGAVEHLCRTCRHSIGTPDGWHLWCERHRFVVVFPCGWWEREAGADLERESPRRLSQKKVIKATGRNRPSVDGQAS